MQELDDQSWQQFVAGSPAAFKQLYKTYYAFVSFLVTKLERHPSEREDLIQEVFLRCWQARTSLAGQDKLAAWLSVTTRRLVIDRWRQHGKSERQHAMTPEELADDNAAVGASLEERLDWRLVRDLVGKQARDEQDDILELFYFKELSVAEIAEQRNLAPSSVTTNLTRARRRIKELLSSLGFNRD